MSPAWKAFERRMAKLFGTTRYPANMGGRADFASETVIGQCKEVKTLSLEQLTQLVEEMDRLATGRQRGVVCVKVRRGRGQASPALIVMSEQTAVQCLAVPAEREPRATAAPWWR